MGYNISAGSTGVTSVSIGGTTYYAGGGASSDSGNGGSGANDPCNCYSPGGFVIYFPPLIPNSHLSKTAASTKTNIDCPTETIPTGYIYVNVSQLQLTYLIDLLTPNKSQLLFLSGHLDVVNTLFLYLVSNPDAYSPEVKELVKRWLDLKIILLTNPNLLLNIPCAEIPKWQALIQLQIPTIIKNKITALDNQSILTDYNIQYLEHASGAAINLDYFPVTINTLPKNPATGQTFTPTQFLDYVRLNINSFVNTSISSFSPTTLNTGYNESQIWNSTNPLGAIIHIDIPLPAGDGSVICSETTSNHWIFTTIKVPYGVYQGQDGIHPVSGNREFGLIQNSNGTYTFYTRGVDRMTDSFDQFMVNGFNVNPFANPDILWNSLKTKVFNFVQNNNGIAESLGNNPNAIYRPDWAKISQVLKGKRPMSDLGCN